MVDNANIGSISDLAMRTSRILSERHFKLSASRTIAGLVGYKTE
jgi:hypothetical protein